MQSKEDGSEEYLNTMKLAKEYVEEKNEDLSLLNRDGAIEGTGSLPVDCFHCENVIAPGDTRYDYVFINIRGGILDDDFEIEEDDTERVSFCYKCYVAIEVTATL